MSNDYRVKSRSDSEVRSLAKRARAHFGLANERRIDVLACLERGSIWTVVGEKKLQFEICSCSAMEGNDGLTTFENGIVRIRLLDTVAEQAFFGEGRARNTCGHELGHGVLWHDRGVPMARQSLELARPDWILPFQSAEHQTKIFAPAFLINDAVAQTMASAEELSACFGISLRSAKIEFDKIVKERNRAKNGREMMRVAQEFRASQTSKPQEIQYLQELCAMCQQAKLFAIGAKYMCQNCNALYDRFQDGDTVS